MRSKERAKSLGEVFTPPELVELMLDRLDSSLWSDPSKTFCDPACGNGNFLVAVVRRKIESGSGPLVALSTTYGVDIMPDNVSEAHRRLLSIASTTSGMTPTEEWAKAVVRNVVCHDSLTYDWEFKAKQGPKVDRYVTALLRLFHVCSQPQE